MAASSIISNPDLKRDVQKTVSRSSEPNVTVMRHPLEVWLRKVFEGREEFLGCTPD